MPGCPEGAEPSDLGRNTQQLLEPASLAATLVTLFVSHRPTAIAGLTASLVDINALCALNPDPPRALTAEDFVADLAYMPGSLPGVDSNLIAYLYEWLRYQAFTQFCVCRPITPNPALNCWHAANIASSGGTGTVIASTTVQIEDAVYNSWQVNVSAWRVHVNVAVTYPGGPPPNSHIYDVQWLDVGGNWRTFTDSRFMGQGESIDLFFDLVGADQLPQQLAQLRIVMAGAVPFTITSLDLCFRPLSVAPQPLPVQDPLPTLPVVPPPVCSTEDLCSIVQELSRQVTRLAGQLSDVQAAVTATSVLQQLDSHPISGEGEITVALGTRAVHVSLTTLGSGVYTSALGRPRGLMRAGSLRWNTAQGFTARTFIDAEELELARPDGGLSVSYQLINGCSGTLHCLG